MRCCDFAVLATSLHIRARAMAARAVVTVVARLALNDDAVAGVVMAVDEQRKDEGEEEHDAVPGVR